MRIWGSVVFCAASLIVASAQNTPTFRAGTRLVQVDVVARSKGKPAEGLQKDDFSILDDGKPQQVAVFSVQSRLIPVTVEHNSTALPAGAISNRMERDDDSLVNASVLFIDQRNTAQAVQAFAIQRIKKYVLNAGENQRIGIYSLRRDGSLQVEQEITSNVALLKAAANSLVARDPSRVSTDTTGMTQHAAEGVAVVRSDVQGDGKQSGDADDREASRQLARQKDADLDYDEF